MPPWLLPAAVTLMWGANTVLIKVLASVVPPLALAAYRMVFAACFLLPAGWIAASRARPAAPAERRHTHWLAWWAGLCMTTLHQLFLGMGMLESQASIGALILGLNPLATALLAAPFAGEPLTPRSVGGALIGFGGVALAVLDDRWHTAGTWALGRGELFMFAAMGAYVAGSLIVRNAAGREPAATFTARMHACGTAVLLAMLGGAALQHRQPLPMPADVGWWGVIIASGAISTGLGLLLWNYSIQTWGATRTSMFLNGLPLTAMLVAAVGLDERIGWAQWSGLAAVAVGIWLGVGPSGGGRSGRLWGSVPPSGPAGEVAGRAQTSTIIPS
ncbi:MAG TPA: DMT family transporter [Limnochordia bacterium]